MKYMLLIHQGDTPTPSSAEWDRLSEDEQKGDLHRLPGDQPHAGRHLRRAYATA